MLRALACLVIVTIPALAQSGPDAFQRGLAAYQKQDYAAARDAFTAALDAGPRTARVFHDLALTNYRLGDKARALGQWRKALAIDPNYAPARAGRELLEAGQHMRAFQGEGAQRLVRHALERIPPFVGSWVLALTVTMFLWALLRHLGARREALAEDRVRPGPGWRLLLSAAVALLTGAAFALQRYLTGDAFATVVTERAPVRSLPNTHAVTLFEVSGGGEVVIKRAQDGWAQIQVPDGATGWVRGDELIPASEI